jgi:SpoVK/Ycf46/Vps4 family AAA+-type ATPase
MNIKYEVFIKKLDKKTNQSFDELIICNKTTHFLNKNSNTCDIDIPNKKNNIYNMSSPKNEIKQKIVINCEIKNIIDIINLIDKYPYHDNYDYNIDLKALHDIKSPLVELNNMIGMGKLKSNIAEQIIYFIQKLNIGSEGDFMHTVLSGPPGTGKTEIAKLIGNIFSKIGILKKGIFKKVTRSDLIAGYLGQTAIKTKQVIEECIGGVLFIDEAYALGNSDKKDSFSKECIDTLCEALSDYKDNLMVIIAGYDNELTNCFFKYNKGLESRFVWRFKTDNYDSNDLFNIFLKKIKDIRWEIHKDCNINEKWFEQNKDKFIFFGRDIETFISKIKISHSNRIFCLSEEHKKKINMLDIENGFTKYLDNKNDNKEDEYFKNYLMNTLYS